MSSREVKDLSPKMQILWNRFNDRVRRDVELKRQDITILLTCTQRLEDRGHTFINRTPSEAFEIVVLRHGKVEPVLLEEITNHAFDAGLRVSNSQFEAREG